MFSMRCWCFRQTAKPSNKIHEKSQTIQKATEIQVNTGHILNPDAKNGSRHPCKKHVPICTAIVLRSIIAGGAGPIDRR